MDKKHPEMQMKIVISALPWQLGKQYAAEEQLFNRNLSRDKQMYRYM